MTVRDPIHDACKRWALPGQVAPDYLWAFLNDLAERGLIAFPHEEPEVAPR